MHVLNQVFASPVCVDWFPEELFGLLTHREWCIQSTERIGWPPQLGWSQWSPTRKVSGSLHATVLLKSTPSETKGSIVVLKLLFKRISLMMGMDVHALECAPLRKYCVTACLLLLLGWAMVSLSLSVFFLVLSEMPLHSRKKSCSTYKI